MKNKIMMWGATVFGIVFIILAVYYWTTPAGLLPNHFPGFKAGVTTPHIKHGVASLLLGLGLFAYAWFMGGSKKTVLTDSANQ